MLVNTFLIGFYSFPREAQTSYKITGFLPLLGNGKGGLCTEDLYRDWREALSGLCSAGRRPCSVFEQNMDLRMRVGERENLPGLACNVETSYNVRSWRTFELKGAPDSLLDSRKGSEMSGTHHLF